MANEKKKTAAKKTGIKSKAKKKILKKKSAAKKKSIKKAVKKAGSKVKKVFKKSVKKALSKKSKKISSGKTAVKAKKSSRQLKKVQGPLWESNLNGVHIRILGTAHISAKSVEDVEALIEGPVKPDVVCIELCKSRYEAMNDPDRWSKLDIVQVIKERKLFLLMSSMILSSFQKKMGDKVKIKPGQEIMSAAELAVKNNIPLELVDRDIQITLKRAWHGLGYWGKMTIISELMVSILFTFEPEPEEIEKMKEKDILEDLFTNLPARYNHIKEILIDERDKYLAQKIKNAVNKYKDAKNIVAVVGAGHLAGIKKYFSGESNLEDLEYIKPKSKIWAAVKFFSPILIIMGLFYYFNSSSPEKVWQNLQAWIIIKASCSGLVALLLWAHPLAIISAALTAPISNFNPVLKPGWVAALIEAKFRKPQVSDFEKLADDSHSLKGIFKNKVIRIFNIFLFPQLASSIGTGLAFWYMSM